MCWTFIRLPATLRAIHSMLQLEHHDTKLLIIRFSPFFFNGHNAEKCCHGNANTSFLDSRPPSYSIGLHVPPYSYNVFKS